MYLSRICDLRIYRMAKNLIKYSCQALYCFILPSFLHKKPYVIVLHSGQKSPNSTISELFRKSRNFSDISDISVLLI